MTPTGILFDISIPSRTLILFNILYLTLMAQAIPLTISAPWPEHILNRYPKSPSTTSNKSTSSPASSTAFSIDAPSSQSSVTSGSSGWSESGWLVESVNPAYLENAGQSSLCNEDRVCWSSQTSSGNPFKTFTPDSRQNPRRTQRLCQHESSTGNNAPLPPPPLVRQCDRKVNFVDSLVGKTR